MKEDVEIKDGKLYYTLSVTVDGERLYPRGIYEQHSANPNFKFYKTDVVAVMVRSKGHAIGECLKLDYVANDTEENSTGTWIFECFDAEKKKPAAKKPAAKKITTKKKTTKSQK